MYDPSKKKQNTVKKTLSDRFENKEKADEFIQEIISSPQEQFDEMLKEIHSEY
ncbi:MAG: hypothetical protein ACFFAU_01925 [Candidatus Hodarchaeota archaeon]